ncbi:hypothetical protein H696_01716 [Fonticula alba]|uniref:HIT-type domain-containing protein n=1 Tax=Fonticula alba TaxID=691883 RepID=A0A058ZD34_FONAL|nr:hypothetical protein H696_01716 [Fonticula alba]KCV72320.1 hypothetical protein H696_01716 [Fonticula alba]|eukprot:XP_009493898.1 hypothetical protein H696_01716 [Fonticula alba]
MSSSQPADRPCGVCSVPDASYRCSMCQVFRFCKVACFRIHKETCALKRPAPENDPDASPVAKRPRALARLPVGPLASSSSNPFDDGIDSWRGASDRQLDEAVTSPELRKKFDSLSTEAAARLRMLAGQSSLATGTASTPSPYFPATVGDFRGSPMDQALVELLHPDAATSAGGAARMSHSDLRVHREMVALLEVAIRQAGFSELLGDEDLDGRPGAGGGTGGRGATSAPGPVASLLRELLGQGGDPSLDCGTALPLPPGLRPTAPASSPATVRELTSESADKSTDAP